MAQSRLAGATRYKTPPLESPAMGKSLFIVTPVTPSDGEGSEALVCGVVPAVRLLDSSALRSSE
jgi:hypothetical protein